MGWGVGKDSPELYLLVVEIVNSRNSIPCASSNYKVQGCATPRGSLAKGSRPFLSLVLVTLQAKNFVTGRTENSTSETLGLKP